MQWQRPWVKGRKILEVITESAYIDFKLRRGNVYTSIIKCGIQLLIHSQTSTVQFGTDTQFHSILCPTCDSLSMLGFKLTHVSKTGTWWHYADVMMGAIASQITSRTIVYSTVYSNADQGKHQSSASLAFVRGIHRWPVNSPHKWPVMRKMFPFDYIIMEWIIIVAADASRHRQPPWPFP